MLSAPFLLFLEPGDRVAAPPKVNEKSYALLGNLAMLFEKL